MVTSDASIITVLNGINDSLTERVSRSSIATILWRCHFTLSQNVFDCLNENLCIIIGTSGIGTKCSILGSELALEVFRSIERIIVNSYTTKNRAAANRNNVLGKSRGYTTITNLKWCILQSSNLEHLLTYQRATC